jgi:hypothetical protein
VSPTVAKWFVPGAGSGHFEMRNTLCPGEFALCSALQGSSSKELRWVAE